MLLCIEDKGDRTGWLMARSHGCPGTRAVCPGDGTEESWWPDTMSVLEPEEAHSFLCVKASGPEQTLISQEHRDTRILPDPGTFNGDPLWST